MARVSRTGGKTSKGSSHKAITATGRESGRAAPRTAQAAILNESHSVAELLKLVDESLAREEASAEILKAINASSGDLTPVFNVILEKAHKLCDVPSGSLQLLKGEYIHAVAVRGLSKRLEQFLRGGYRVTPGVRQVLDPSRPVQTPDLAELLARMPDEPSLRAPVEFDGIRTLLSVPLVKEGVVLGRIVAARREVRPFTEQQISLLQTFAVQAVIAMENARLFNETKEALKRQTATADILKLIASSPSNVQPVFDAIAHSAKQLMGGVSAGVYRYHGEVAHLAAFTPTDPAADEVLVRSFPRPITETAFALTSGGSPAQVTDTEQAEEQVTRDIARARGFRSLLLAPLLKNNNQIGIIAVTRTDPSSFAEQDVHLLQTFAAQAVIAIENARSFKEVQDRTNDLSESLQQQTATADVLKTISRSAFDLDTVLKSLIMTATRLCETEHGQIFRRDGEIYRYAASLMTLTPEYREIEERVEVKAGRGTLIGRVAQEKRTVQIIDALQDTEYAEKESAKIGSVRTMLGVPMLRNGECIGAFALARTEVRPFTQRQIDLVTTFADQAVIAMESARLFNETKEALERQTATSDILKVIASSPYDVQPVFEAIAERSNRLMNGLATSVYSIVDDTLHLMAFTKSSPEADAALQASFPRPLSIHRWADQVRHGEILEIADAEGEWSDDPNFREVVRLRGFRSVLFVPLRRDATTIGLISVTRSETGKFSPNHVQLLQTFADQAVIAISNVQLFEQVQQRTQELSKSLDNLRTAQDRLVQTEKLASLGQLTAGIAHEIKNPLNFVNNFSALSVELTDELQDTLKQATLADQLRDEVDELTGLLKSNLEKIVQHGKRADSIVKNMLLHSRESSGERRSADVNALVSESLNLAYHGARAEKPGFAITLKHDLDPDAGALELYPQEMTRALLNLLSNGFYAALGRKAAMEDEAFEPVVSASTRNLGEAVEIRIRDNGSGIPPEVKEKMFNPFFTTKPTGEGTGLGLSMTHDIVVKQHGGRIDVETEPGAFTEFIVTLPRGHDTAAGLDPE